MTFAHPWVLFLLVLPLLFLASEWRKSASRIGLFLKAAAFVAILLALASPRIDVDTTKVATVVLADTSASVSQADLQKESNLVKEIERQRGRHWLRIIPFARASRDVDASEKSRGWQLKHSAGDAGRGTDIEAAVRDAIAGLPSGMAPRIALISDGRENEGSVARAAWLARDLHIPIDTFPLAGQTSAATAY